MEAVVFCGIQASGKTTYYARHFLHTHVRISLDLLRTRHRETLFLEACLDSQMRFVVDNTNPTREERARYVAPALARRYRVVAYLFETDTAAAIARNADRGGRQAIPVSGVLGTRKRLEPPSLDEGFEAIYAVRLGAQDFEAVRRLA
jgi:predicted kinase